MITPLLNVSSLLLGLAAWGFGIAALRRRKISLTSFALCLLALVLQFAELTHRAQSSHQAGSTSKEPWKMLSAGTLFLNTLAYLRSK